jgi:hypothetical protein
MTVDLAYRAGPVVPEHLEDLQLSGTDVELSG